MKCFACGHDSGECSFPVALIDMASHSDLFYSTVKNIVRSRQCVACGRYWQDARLKVFVCPKCGTMKVELNDQEGATK